MHRVQLRSRKNKVYIGSLFKRGYPQHIASWTGFHLLIKNKIAVANSSFGYLDVTDDRAKEISSVYPGCM